MCRFGVPLWWCALIVGVPPLAGCHGSTALYRNRISDLKLDLGTLGDDGAYRCAPRELALATAHLEFAESELAQGDARRVERHLSDARDNLSAARLLSPRERCGEGAVAEATDSPGSDADGDGVLDAADRCPDQAEDRDGFLDHDGCPDPDNDRDGVPDTIDQCPNEAEDADGVQDQDGCADRDNDGDGVDDTLDRCPTQPGSPAAEGCPRLKYPKLELTPRDIRVQEPIQFEGTTDTIRSVSHALLDTVVVVLQEHPEVQLEVQGHTDSQGNDAKNQSLSQARADAVRGYLVSKGIDPSRLTARGYGETRPIESNRTSQGRAINRRIELVRTDGPR